ncbi:MAG: cytochrome c3 family protein, partial [Gemmatimonadales bacterium]
MPTTSLTVTCFTVLALFASTSSTASAQQGVRQTVHNLSASGSGAIGSSTEQEVCIFCHTPHGANTAQRPIWNRDLSSASYIPYDSPSAQASIGQPNGDSKLCLSCHDGTIAIGNVLNPGSTPGSIPVGGTDPDGTMPEGSTLIGTNLLNDHPVSFVYDASLATEDGELADPGALTGPVQLRPGSSPVVLNSLQCTTCHDPHTDSLPSFLRKDMMGRSDNLCLTCHTKSGWSGSTHESATDFWPSGQTTTGVSDHSCVACHTPHADTGAERLLRGAVAAGQSAIEEACFRCHQSSTTGGIAQNIQDEFTKPHGHPITMNPGTHRPVFIPRPPSGLPENVALNPGSSSEDGSFSEETHVECVDCHNPHRVTSTNRSEG